MWNIVRAQQYQLRRDTLTIIFTLIAFFACICPVLFYDGEYGDLTGSACLMSGYSLWAGMMMFYPLFVVSRACGMDWKDKTINYEVMSGHSRAQVFFGRAISAYIWGTVVAALLAILPVFCVSVVCGFGDKLLLSEIIVNFLLFTLCCMRWVAELIFVTILTRSAAAGAGLGYGLFAVSGSVSVVCLMKELNPWWGKLFIMNNYMQLTDLENTKSKLAEINGSMTEVLDLSMKGSEIFTLCLISVAGMALCLFGGCHLFKTRDMR